jgi:hypothetical protein
MNKSSASAVTRLARNLWRIGGFKVINLSHFRKGDVRGRLRSRLSKADRLVLQHRRDDRFLRLVMRTGIPDTIHIDRAVASTIPIPDDRHVVAEKQDERDSARTRQLVLTRDRNT